MEDYMPDHNLLNFNLSHLEDSDFKCPNDNAVMKKYPKQDGPDDFVMVLICPVCHLIEE